MKLRGLLVNSRYLHVSLLGLLVNSPFTREFARFTREFTIYS
ncbi:hypothetical protein [Peribacillus frigoritolerans]|nr:hypothetical protein [Peribacillus frigoritolerans]